MSKPPLIVSAYDPHPRAGSEQGKAFHWTMALAEFYTVHVLCLPHAAKLCDESGACNDWMLHPVDIGRPLEHGLKSYLSYHVWCRTVVRRCRELVPQIRPVGLHHPAMGSFRLLPRYEALGIPFTLGPLGGGETAPWRLLRGARLPLKQLAWESLRAPINRACVLNPVTTRTLKRAARVLATTAETERLLQGAGTRSTAVVFPDVFVPATGTEDPIGRRTSQTAELATEFRCIWSGRFLWWKGGQMALEFVRRLNEAGIKASLDIYSDGPGIECLKAMAAREVTRGRVRFLGLVPREELLAAYRNAHLFVYPTLHDSSSSAIPEAYSTGLPTMTLGLGGAGTASSPDAGINAIPDSIPDWYNTGLASVRKWINQPDTWLAACSAAKRRSGDFSLAAIVEAVREHLLPCWK